MRFKICYAVAMGAAFALGVLLFWKYRAAPLALLIVIVVASIPGRLQGFFYRDLFSGRRLLEGGRPADALVCFDRFLATLRAAPWRKHLLWLAFSVYTIDAEAMTLNNIGVAHLTQGRLDLQRHLARDRGARCLDCGLDRVSSCRRESPDGSTKRRPHATLRSPSC